MCAIHHLTQGSWGGQLICLGYFSSELVNFVSRLLSRYKENMLCSEGSVREHCWFRENNCDEEEDVTSLCTWGQESGGSRKMRYMLKRTMLVIMRRLMFLKLFR